MKKCTNSGQAVEINTYGSGCGADINGLGQIQIWIRDNCE